MILQGPARRHRAVSFAFVSLLAAICGDAFAVPGWTPVHPGSLEKRAGVAAVATDPRHQGRVYAAVGQHLHLSVDGGGTFVRLGSVPAPDPILAIALLLDDAKPLPRILVGTRTRGVWVSDDGGRRFTPSQTSGVTPMFIRDLLVAPGSDRVVVLNQYPRAYLSDDAGLNWRPFDVEGRVVPFAPTGFYNARESGLYRSTDAGATWMRVGNGLPRSTVPYEIAIDPARPAIVFAILASVGTFRSSDGGLNFTWTGPPIARSEALHLEVFGEALWLTGWNPLSSGDGGNRWNAPLPPGTVGQDAAYDALSQRTYVGAVPGGDLEGGLWRTQDDASPGEAGWRNDSRGLSAAWVSSLIVDPGRNLYAAAWQWAPLHRLLPDEQGWQNIPLPEKYLRDGSPLGPISAPVVPGGPGQLVEASWPFSRSDDAGENWRSEVQADTPAAFLLASEPGNPDVLYGGRDRLRSVPGSPTLLVDGTQLWVSRDRGRTWADIGIPESPMVSRLLATGSGRLVAHTSDGLWFNAGAAWTRVDSVGMPVLDARSRLDRPRDVFVAATSGLHRSDDGGTTFRQVSALPDADAGFVAIDWHTADDVYAVTRSGAVHASRDGGASWTALPTELPFEIRDVAVSPWNAGVLYAATSNGVYTLVARPDVATAHEFHHAEFDHYFVTASAEEASQLIAGALPSWRPTGRRFAVWRAGSGGGHSPVCRFFSATFAPRSSHFYTPYPSECEAVRRGDAWQDEGTAFDLVLPQGRDGSRSCPIGTQPLYRVYNDGRSGAPNHRYTTGRALADAMVVQQWRLEGEATTGVFACVPAQQ